MSSCPTEVSKLWHGAANIDTQVSVAEPPGVRKTGGSSSSTSGAVVNHAETLAPEAVAEAGSSATAHVVRNRTISETGLLAAVALTLLPHSAPPHGNAATVATSPPHPSDPPAKRHKAEQAEPPAVQHNYPVHLHHMIGNYQQMNQQYELRTRQERSFHSPHDTHSSYSPSQNDPYFLAALARGLPPKGAGLLPPGVGEGTCMLRAPPVGYVQFPGGIPDYPLSPFPHFPANETLPAGGGMGVGVGGGVSGGVGGGVGCGPFFFDPTQSFHPLLQPPQQRGVRGGGGISGGVGGNVGGGYAKLVGGTGRPSSGMKVSPGPRVGSGSAGGSAKATTKRRPKRPGVKSVGGTWPSNGKRGTVDAMGRTVDDRKMEELIANGWTCSVKQYTAGKKYKCVSPGGVEFTSVNKAYDQYEIAKEKEAAM